MKIARVRDAIEKASNSKIKSRKKINFWTSLLFTSKSSAYLNRFLHRGIRLRKRSWNFILAFLCIFTRRFLIEAISDIEPLQNLNLLSGLIGTTGAETLLICSLLLVNANRKYSNQRIRKWQSNRMRSWAICKKNSHKFLRKIFLLRFKLSFPKLFSFSLKNPEGCRVKEIIGIITLLYEVDPGDKYFCLICLRLLHLLNLFHLKILNYVIFRRL